MRDAIRSMVAAVSFLTAVPVGRRATAGPRDLADGSILFPIVGAAVGAAMAGVAWAAALVLPPLPAGVLGVGAGVVLTAALHLDGLADTADGVGAAFAGADPLTAMHDSRLGVFGGAAVVLDLMLRVSVLAALLAGGRFPVEAIAAGALARAAAIALVAIAPYAGGSSGTGAWTRGIGSGRCLASIALALAIGAVAVGSAVGAMAIASLTVVLVLARWSRRHLGGATGDALGATVEVSETLSLAAALAMR